MIMIKRSGSISDSFGKSLEKIAVPVPAWLPAPEIAWDSLTCPDCKETWGVGREPHALPPETSCPWCKGQNVNVTKEMPGNSANDKDNP